MYLKASDAVLLMVKDSMVLKSMDSEEGDLFLLWWNERCSCFHYSHNGAYMGIYTGGTFYNYMPFFKFRADRGDDVLLYKQYSKGFKPTSEMTFTLICELENRRDMEVLYTNQMQL